jgi:hypothetical protein
MSDPKDGKEGESFFRKVARFVANPTTDWAEINSRQDDPEGDLAKAELRAMVERKRRNDFVRKRELDMLRRIRREGLSPEQLAALGASSSRLDEMERNGVNSEINSKVDPRVKDKINEIEQQMVGESYAPTQHQTGPAPAYYDSTRPAHFNTTLPAGEPAGAPSSMLPNSRVSEYATREEIERMEAAPPPAAVTMGAGMSPLSDARPSVLPSVQDLPPLEMSPLAAPLSFEVAAKAPAHVVAAPPPPVQPEFEHDPDLDEAVIAFANADFEGAERVLTTLTQAGAPRHQHGQTWLTLFDLYRATGAQAKFEALAPDYVQQFGLSAPQWYSMPKLVAESLRNQRAPMGRAGNVAWTAPEFLDVESVSRLHTRCQNLPMPWVLDWSALRSIDGEAGAALCTLFRSWATQQVDLRWLAGDQFLQLLKDQAPVAQRDVDPAVWMLRLEALRIVNRPDQFDEAAIDYCVTYEVSPPSWERAVCRVRVSGLTLSTSAPASTTMNPTESPSSFLESTITENAHLSSSVQLELSGQLSGDISETLKLMTSELGAASQIFVACPKLIRLDFMAAGDLLNWVLARRSENRSVAFTETHRLVALFFGAMGINEHARIRVKQT